MSDNICPICSRVMLLGTDSVNEHHLLPKCKGGKVTVSMHRICHRKIHSLFTENELRDEYNTAQKLLEHEEIIKFVKWVKNKPLDYYDSSATSKRKKKSK